MKKALVVFGKTLPKKGSGWWKQFAVVIAPEELHTHIPRECRALEELLLPGSVVEATALLRKLSLLKTPEGKRVSKLVNYHGYELWWAYYDELMYRLCLPYTQFQKLLAHLLVYDEVTIWQPAEASLFQHYLAAHKKKFEILGVRSPKFPSLGIVLEFLANIPFLLWLMVRRPKVMLWTSDRFDPPLNVDFRLTDVYQELYRRKIPFVEFIRSMEPTSTMLSHLFARKRAVFYSYAQSRIIRLWVGAFGGSSPLQAAYADPQDLFLFKLATHYLPAVKGDIYAIRAMEWTVRLIGIKVAMITSAQSRNMIEVLACKLAGIPTLGIMQGASSKEYVAFDFMTEFDGEKTLSADRYGLWSEWWKEYYLKHSSAYRPEQLFVSGPMRPLSRSNPARSENSKQRVLFIAEQLAAPEEVLPYLLKLIENTSIELTIKFRSYHDGFEEWLTHSEPALYKRLTTEARIERGTMPEAVAKCDVVVGSHSTAVLESLLLLRPPVFFWTNKWGDYFDLKSEGLKEFFADTPEELLLRIQAASSISEDKIKGLQERFFGDPHQNGSAWVVDEAQNYL